MPGSRLTVVEAPWPGWDRLAGHGDWRLRSDWLALYRRRPRGREVTVLLERGGSPAVGLLGFFLDEPSADPRLDPGTVHGARASTPALALLAPDWRCQPVGPLAGDVGALDALLGALRDHARAWGLAGVALLYVPDDAPLAAAAARAGWARAPLPPWCDLEVRWRDLDGYRAALPRRDRQQVGRDRRALAAAGVSIERVPLDRWTDGLLRLRGRLLARHRRPPDEAADRACLERVAALDHLLYAATAGDRLLGFTLLVRHGEELAAYWTGRDDGDARSSCSYFATAFYGPAADAPALGVRWIRYGLGSAGAKRSRGCSLVPLSAWWGAATASG